MPIYPFDCEKCKVHWDAYLTMDDKKVSKCPKCKKKISRSFTTPNVKTSGKIDPFNLNELTKRTGDMKGTMGDLWDFSREMSDKRAEKLGKEDPIRKKTLDEYAKKRGGIKYKEINKAKKDGTITVKLGG